MFGKPATLVVAAATVLLSSGGAYALLDADELGLGLGLGLGLSEGGDRDAARHQTAARHQKAARHQMAARHQVRLALPAAGDRESALTHR